MVASRVKTSGFRAVLFECGFVVLPPYFLANLPLPSRRCFPPFFDLRVSLEWLGLRAFFLSVSPHSVSALFHLLRASLTSSSMPRPCILYLQQLRPLLLFFCALPRPCMSNLTAVALSGPRCNATPAGQFSPPPPLGYLTAVVPLGPQCSATLVGLYETSASFNLLCFSSALFFGSACLT